MVLYWIRVYNTAQTIFLNMISYVLADDIDNLFFHQILNQGYHDKQIETTFLNYQFPNLILICIIAIQIHISYYEYALTGLVQSYSKKSLKLLLMVLSMAIISGHLWIYLNEYWLNVFLSFIYNITAFISGPIAIVWLNENANAYFIFNVRRIICKKY